jgi:pyruvate/2-oxoglutarate dehydrogenase complex dihydrolipoamide dehydrogenase (E3) component
MMHIEDDMNDIYDVVVIGAGAAGLTAAGGPAMLGLKVALIEEGPMGGDCLNTGCVPSKALISAAGRAHEANRGLRLGITLDQAKVDWIGVRDHIRQAIATIAPVDSQERFEGLGVEVIRDRGILTDDRTVQVGGRQLKAKRIVIATGSRPRIPDIPGLSDIPYLTNETIFDIDALPRHLAIMGGGAIGMEMAQSFRRLGAEVTVVEQFRPFPRDDADGAALVMKALEHEGVVIRAGVAVTAVERSGDDIILVLGDGVRVSASHLLVSAGRVPNTEGIGLEAAGVKVGKDGIIVDARRRTTNKRIYAVGDCRQGPRFTHSSGYDGSIVVANLALGLPSKADFRALPWVTYTDPELAQVGLTEAAARAQFGDKVSATRENFSHNDRAIAEGETEGFLKIVRVGSKVVGATIVGRHAGDLLLPWSQVILGKASVFGLSGMIVAYPNRSDISKAVAFKAYEPSIFGKWPKRWARFLAGLRR